jgi:hypothetical protein
MTCGSLKDHELIGKTASRNAEPAVGSSYQVNDGLGQAIHHYIRRLLGHPSLTSGFKIDILCIDRLVLYIHNCTDNV